jgi:hypothetical protein
MSVIGTLTVNLVANTAQFAGDMGQAAKNVFNFGQNAQDAGKKVDYSMHEARESIQVVGEEFGLHLPRALTGFIASLGPIGPALEAAFPFLAIVVGATLLIEHLAKVREESDKLAEAHVQFGTTIQTVFGNLEEKLLEAGIKIDDLNENHLGALEKTLELIDRKSFTELAQQFDIISKSADVMLSQLTEHWYNIGTVETNGAASALKHFKSEYDSLLAQGKQEEAHGLLTGTLKQAQDFYGVMYAQQEGHGSSPEELARQQALVDALKAQLTVETKITELKDAQAQAAQISESKSENADADKLFKAQAEAAKTEADQTEKVWEQSYQEAVSALQESEKQKIAATRTGTAERLAAIDAAIAEEDTKGLQETAFYKSLLVERVNAVKQAADQEAKIREGLADESVRHEEAMQKIQFDSAREAAKQMLALYGGTADQAAQIEAKAAHDSWTAQVEALNNKLAALDQYGAEYEKKQKEIQDRIIEVEADGWAKERKILQDATIKKLNDIRTAEQRMQDTFAQTTARSIVENERLGESFEQMGKQILQQALTNLLQLQTVQGQKRFSDARTAAADAFAAADGNIFLGAAWAAAAFAAVMAFEKGGEIPGSGPVPIIAHGGETVVTRALTDQVRNSYGNGSSNGGGNRATVIYNIDAREADPGVEHRVMKAIAKSENRAVARSVSYVNESARRR